MQVKRSKQMSPSNKYEAGFTLLELLVVLVILGLLTTIVGPQVMKMLGNAKSDIARIQMGNIGSALDLFNLDVGRYPSEKEGLNVLVRKPIGIERWSGPYLKSNTTPIDPWEQPYLYRQPGKDNKPYELKSLGADKQRGGSGENADIITP